MKIAVSAQGEGLKARVDPRFGRAKYFVVYDTESGECQAIDNAVNLNAAQGAGIQAAKKVVELGADALLTGNVGPKAFATLEAGMVAIYTGADGTVVEALEAMKDGKLEQAGAATVDGHWV